MYPHAKMLLDVLSCQDCNSLLSGSFNKDLNRLQLLQNRAAKLVYNLRKYDYVSPLFTQLHWLKVQQRIIYKILTLIFKCIHGPAPIYLQSIISLYVPSRPGLRSETDLLMLSTPKTHLKSDPKGFFAQAPLIWNRLPFHIRQSNKSFMQFKSLLKTHLFKSAL